MTFIVSSSVRISVLQCSHVQPTHHLEFIYTGRDSKLTRYCQRRGHAWVGLAGFEPINFLPGPFLRCVQIR